MKCPACGFTGNGDQTRFCRKCGESLILGESAKQAESPTLVACPKCGTDNRPGSQFCRSCGESLEVVPPVPTVDVEPYITCPACWLHNPVGTVFCKSCGARLDDPVLAPLIVSTPLAPVEDTIPESTPVAAVETAPSPAPQIAEETVIKPPLTAPSNEGTGISPKPNQYVIAIIIVIVLALAGGFGVYYWWQQGKPIAPAQPPIPMVTVQPAPNEPTTPASSDVPSAPEVANSMPAQTETRQTEPEPAPVDIKAAKQVERSTPVITKKPHEESPPQRQFAAPADREPPPARHHNNAGVDQAVARECGDKSGLAHSLCKERVRFGICSGRWGTTPDCPDYEHKDGPGF